MVKDTVAALKALLSHPEKPVQPVLRASKAIFSMLEQRWYPWMASVWVLGDPCPGKASLGCFCLWWGWFSQGEVLHIHN